MVFTWKNNKQKNTSSWKQEVTTGMRENGFNNMKWIDREEWRRK